MGIRVRPVIVAAIALSLALSSGCSAGVGGVAVPAGGQPTPASSAAGPAPTTSPAAHSSQPSTLSSEPSGSDESDSAASTPGAGIPGSPASTTTEVTGGSVVDPGTPTSSGDAAKGTAADCLAVASAYASITFAILPILQGQTGSGAFDAGALTHAFAELGGQVPPELASDFATLSSAAKQVVGKTLAEAGTIFNTPAVTTAQSHIEKWLSDKC